MVDLHCHLNLPLNRILFKLFFIYSRSKNITVADINNRLGKITNNPATLYARISCTRSFLAWRNKVELIYIRPIWKKKKNVFFPQERWKKANLEKHVFLDSFMAFGSGKYQCPGRSVRQLGHVYPESLWKDDGAKGESFGLLFLFFTIKLQGKPGDHILLGWAVVSCIVYM